MAQSVDSSRVAGRPIKKIENGKRSAQKIGVSVVIIGDIITRVNNYYTDPDLLAILNLCRGSEGQCESVFIA